MCLCIPSDKITAENAIIEDEIRTTGARKPPSLRPRLSWCRQTEKSDSNYELAMAFFSHLSQRTLAQSAAMANAIKNVTVIGSGLMGAGIAQVR